MSTVELANLVTRLENVVQRLESKAGSGSSSGVNVEDLPQFINDYDTFVSQYVEPYMNASAALGGVIDDQAKVLKKASNHLRQFLIIVAKCSAPKNEGILAKLVEPIGKCIGELGEFKDKLDRKSNLINHVRAAGEGGLMFVWVTIPKTPMKQIKETKDTVMFYTNKVLKEFKSSDDSEKHKSWVQKYLQVFEGMRDYIKDHHTTGLSWNTKGSPATPEAYGQGSPVPPPPGAPAPPPPPPPSAAPIPVAAAPGPSAGAVNALMQDINRGTDVTKGLKKVTNDMKTHKNPELRKHHVPVPFKPKPTAYKPMGKAAVAKAPTKPPKVALEGKKWIVEYQEKANLKLDECEMRQTIYAFKCNNTTISVSSKVNSIVLDTCKKTGLVFDSVVSGVEVVNCQSVQVQAQGQMHSVSIDKTDGCIIYLSKECLNANIVTAKSSEMNVSVPKDDGDFDEYPIVEQFRSTWDAAKKTFITVPSEQLG